MGYWDNEETIAYIVSFSPSSFTCAESRPSGWVCLQRQMGEGNADLFESSAIPAKALYQAKNAASRAKNPPALMMGALGMFMASRWR